MSANSFGNRFVVTTFGESHGPALGAIIDGCPAGVPFDFALLERELARRRPGAHSAGTTVVSSRNEADLPEVLSGVHEGKTLGTPIAILVRNLDARSKDYDEIARKSRPGHADQVWLDKFGHVDPRGGGRSSGRETVARVMAGAVARMLIRALCPELRILGFSSRIGPLSLEPSELAALSMETPVDEFVARIPSLSKSREAEALLLAAKSEGNSLGGTAELWMDGVPKGLGQPVFHKIKADLASAFLGVGATAGVEIGAGFESAFAEGTEFHIGDADSAADIRANYGGISGGITTGERIRASVAFKPTSSILDVAKRGRHDPCIVPRAIPVLEAMAYLVIADHLLWARQDRSPGCSE